MVDREDHAEEDGNATQAHSEKPPPVRQTVLHAGSLWVPGEARAGGCATERPYPALSVGTRYRHDQRGSGSILS